MSYTKDAGEVSARYRPGGEVPSVTYPSGTHVVFTAPGSATNGQYGLFEWNMTGTRGGADPHFHKTFSESFYVMEGTVRLFNGETWIDAVKGDFLYVPQGGIHAFSNESGAPARMLILFAPGPPRRASSRAMGLAAELARYAFAAGRGLTQSSSSRHGLGPCRIAVHRGHQPHRARYAVASAPPGSQPNRGAGSGGGCPGPGLVRCGAGDRAGYASRAGDLQPAHSGRIGLRLWCAPGWGSIAG